MHIPSHSGPGVRNGRHPLFILIALSAIFFLTACPLDFADLDQPQVLNMTISPSSISYGETTSSNQFFSIEISVANFDDDVIDASVFIQQGNRTAEAGPTDIIDGNLILFEENIEYFWFSGYEPGTYEIGVEVISPTITHTQRNQATVTITP